jgi:hypothetical protein
MILSPLSDTEDQSKVSGIVDLLFEIIYGSGEGLHSKTSEILNSLLSIDCIKESTSSIIRSLFMKLVTEIDIKKQELMYETLKLHI